MQSFSSKEWWRGAAIYEVYLRSFADSDGDGEGDLNGLADRLEYLAWLGVEAIWITPFFPSPMHDSGYDVADYRDVDPRFGTLEAFKEVTRRAHDLGLKVVIDQVYSHSSNDHPWFRESCRSESEPRSDWYVWADAKPDGSPPNNWLARFGGIAWEWNAQRRQYYFHNFLVEQPDLNVHNPGVQQELLETMDFWFDLGVDGLRLDVANFFMHDPALRDNPSAEMDAKPANPYYMQQRLYDRSRPENLPFLERMREVAGDRMLLAEISCDQQVERMKEYTEPGRLHTAYSFELLGPSLSGTHVAEVVQRAGSGDSWPTWAFSNHDVVRVASRWQADGQNDRLKMLHALLLSLRGTVILYQGEELGLPHAKVPREQMQDPEGIRFWPHDRGRDGARAPFPWDNTPELGFSTSQTPWLPYSDAYRPLAVSEQRGQNGSVLEHCRGLLELRRTIPALRTGGFEVLEARQDSLVFRRTHDDGSVLCAFNFAEDPLPIELPDPSNFLAGRVGDRVLTANGFLIAKEPA